MDIVVRGRQREVPDRFRRHVAEKLGKVGKLDPRVHRLDVEISRERNPRMTDIAERVEVTVLGKGPVIRAEAAAPDAYAALDLAVAKLEERLRRARDRRKDHHATAPVRTAPAEVEAPADEAAESAPEPSVIVVADETGVDADGRVVVREKIHDAEPMSVEQALFEMELVGHDFFLFADAETGNPSVVYKRKGYRYGVLRLNG